VVNAIRDFIEPECISVVSRAGGLTLGLNAGNG
jgi:hypothetical protein